MALGEQHRADGVFEGGGVKGVAFAGALAAAREAGVREWVNVAGTSAGAIVAALLVAGYDADGLRAILGATDARRFAEIAPPWRWLRVVRTALTRRGLVTGEAFTDWLGEQLARSPGLARAGATFADVRRTDLPPDAAPEARARARYRLRVIASDVTAGRLLVLPDDAGDYAREPGGPPIRPDALTVVEAVRMSMSFPYVFAPVVLYRDGREHLIVDGGVLSNFPVWLFDAPEGQARRPTYGFRLHPGLGPERPPYHRVGRLTWPVGLTRALVLSATEAWDARLSSCETAVRTVSIPTGDVGTLAFGLSAAQRADLYAAGLRAGRAFFAQRRAR